MTEDMLLSTLFLIALAFYFLRGSFNWILLNKVKGTNHPRIFNANPNDLILTLRHLTTSFVKIWWKGEEYRTMKTVSNALSGLLYFSIVVLIFIYLIAYQL